MIRNTILLVLATALFLCGSAPAAGRDAAERPNFIIILVDDLGWTDLSCQGSEYYETPHVDRLALQGMRFTNGYAACAVCSPTRAAVQTGRYPARVGITDWIRARFQGAKLPPPGQEPPEYVRTPKGKLLCPRNPLYMKLDELTIAEALHGAGYVCCHIGKWHLGPRRWFPEKQGYDVNLGGCELGQPPSYFDPFRSKRKHYVIPNLEPRRPGEYLTDREADEAAAFIRRHKDRPFFLNLCHYAVHTPLMAKKELIDKYEAKPKTNQKNPVFAAMVQSVDEATGRIMKTLDELGLAENTIVIFTSDNGGLLGPTDNSPLRAGKGYPYEGGLRVPLLVRWPKRVAPGGVCHEPACGIDFFPTLLEIAGVPLPRDRAIDGESLLPLLTKTGALRRDALYWHFPHYRRPDVEPYSIIRAGPWKLIRRYDSRRRELYNLDDDIGETDDLAPLMPERVERLDRRLSAWLKATGAKLPKPAANR